MKTIKNTWVLLVLITINACSQTSEKPKIENQKAMKNETIQVEIWSDVVCPFCYIGKRNFENALAQFDGKNKVEVTWKSFQLNPNLDTNTNESVNVYQYLADAKGISYEQSVAMHDNVNKMAKQAGLNYDFDNAKVANTMKAHCLIQLAKEKGLGNEAEERLFKAHFTEGKNIGKEEVLLVLGKEIGLDEKDILSALNSEDYINKVKADLQEAQQVGVTGVPFFVINRQYAISGAQPEKEFLKLLKQVSE